MKPYHFPTALLLVLALLAAACAPQAATAGAPTPAEPNTLTVLAAASLTEAFSELGALFETRRPGVKVALSFAGSQQLTQQLSQGAAADVFASANQKYMDAAADAGRVNAGEVKIFARNRLVVVYPRANPGGLSRLQDLARPGLKLVLADKSVPVGSYALDFLERAGQDPAFDPAYQEDVLNNVVSYEDNVKGVIAKVGLDEADAGIVYVTDIGMDARNQVSSLDIPDALNTIATYPIAALADSRSPALAQAFVALVLSPDGQAILAKYGFIPAGD